MQKYEVVVKMGDVFVNGKFVAQLCWDAEAIGCALASYINGDYDEEESDADVAMRESLGSNWW